MWGEKCTQNFGPKTTSEADWWTWSRWTVPPFN